MHHDIQQNDTLQNNIQQNNTSVWLWYKVNKPQPKPGWTNWKERFSTTDLLIKLTRFIS
jgi:hypothetical protein